MEVAHHSQSTAMQLTASQIVSIACIAIPNASNLMPSSMSQCSQGCLHPNNTGPSFFARYISYLRSAHVRSLQTGKDPQRTTLRHLKVWQNICIAVVPVASVSVSCRVRLDTGNIMRLMVEWNVPDGHGRGGPSARTCWQSLVESGLVRPDSTATGFS